MLLFFAGLAGGGLAESDRQLRGGRLFPGFSFLLTLAFFSILYRQGATSGAYGVAVPKPADGCTEFRAAGGPATAASAPAAATRYPNPAAETATLTLGPAAPAAYGQVRDLMGTLVREFEADGTHPTTLRLHDLKPGLYVVELTSAAGRQRLRLSIERP